MFDFEVSALEALLELDNDSDGREIFISNHAQSPTSNIYCLIPNIENYSLKLSLEGPEADLMILVQNDIALHDLVLKGFQKILISDFNYEIDNGLLVIGNQSQKHRIAITDSEISNLYIYANNSYLGNIIVDYIYGSFFGDDSKLKINDSKIQPSAIAELEFDHEHLPSCVEISNSRISILKNYIDIAKLELNNLQLAASLDNIFNVKASNCLISALTTAASEININSDEQQIGAINASRAIINLCPKLQLKIINSNYFNNWSGVELNIDLTNIVDPVARKLDFPASSSTLSFTKIKITGASNLSILSNITAETIEFINCPKVDTGEIKTIFLLYEAAAGEVDFGLQNASPLSLDVLMILGKVKVNFWGESNIKYTLDTEGYVDLMIRNNFYAKRINLNPQITSSLTFTEEIGLLVDIAGDFDKCVIIEELLAKISKFVLRGNFKIDHCIVYPINDTQNYFHMDIGKATQVIKHMLCSFRSDILLSSKGDIYFLHGTKAITITDENFIANCHKIVQSNDFSFPPKMRNEIVNDSSLTDKFQKLTAEFRNIHHRPSLYNRNVLEKDLEEKQYSSDLINIIGGADSLMYFLPTGYKMAMAILQEIIGYSKTSLNDINSKKAIVNFSNAQMHELLAGYNSIQPKNLPLKPVCENEIALSSNDSDYFASLNDAVFYKYKINLKQKSYILLFEQNHINESFVHGINITPDKFLTCIYSDQLFDFSKITYYPVRIGEVDRAILFDLANRNQFRIILDFDTGFIMGQALTERDAQLVIYDALEKSIEIIDSKDYNYQILHKVKATDLVKIEYNQIQLQVLISNILKPWLANYQLFKTIVNHKLFQNPTEYGLINGQSSKSSDKPELYYIRGYIISRLSGSSLLQLDEHQADLLLWSQSELSESKADLASNNLLLNKNISLLLFNSSKFIAGNLLVSNDKVQLINNDLVSNLPMNLFNAFYHLTKQSEKINIAFDRLLEVITSGSLIVDLFNIERYLQEIASFYGINILDQLNNFDKKQIAQNQLVEQIIRFTELFDKDKSLISALSQNSQTITQHKQQNLIYTDYLTSLKTSFDLTSNWQQFFTKDFLLKNGTEILLFNYYNKSLTKIIAHSEKNIAVLQLKTISNFGNHIFQIPNIICYNGLFFAFVNGKMEHLLAASCDNKIYLSYYDQNQSKQQNLSEQNLSEDHLTIIDTANNKQVTYNFTINNVAQDKFTGSDLAHRFERRLKMAPEKLVNNDFFVCQTHLKQLQVKDSDSEFMAVLSPLPAYLEEKFTEEKIEDDLYTATSFLDIKQILHIISAFINKKANYVVNPINIKAYSYDLFKQLALVSSQTHTHYYYKPEDYLFTDDDNWSELFAASIASKSNVNFQFFKALINEDDAVCYQYSFGAVNLQIVLSNSQFEICGNLQVMANNEGKMQKATIEIMQADILAGYKVTCMLKDKDKDEDEAFSMMSLTTQLSKNILQAWLIERFDFACNLIIACLHDANKYHLFLKAHEILKRIYDLDPKLLKFGCDTYLDFKDYDSANYLSYQKLDANPAEEIIDEIKYSKLINQKNLSLINPEKFIQQYIQPIYFSSESKLESAITKIDLAKNIIILYQYITGRELESMENYLREDAKSEFSWLDSLSSEAEFKKELNKRSYLQYINALKTSDKSADYDTIMQIINCKYMQFGGSKLFVEVFQKIYEDNKKSVEYSNLLQAKTNLMALAKLELFVNGAKYIWHHQKEN